VDGKKLVTEYTAGLPAGTVPNIIRVEDEKLVSSFNSADVLALVYDYYQQRYLQKTKLFASLAAPGDSVYMNTQSSMHLKGIIERMETDLAKGFVSVCDVIGVVV